MRSKFGLMCVRCGEDATEGAMRFPFCKKCYRKEFKTHDDFVKAYCRYTGEGMGE